MPTEKGAQDPGQTMRAFRDACGRFATGVTVINALVGDEVHAMTANAFMSVSLDPLLIAVGVSHTTKMHKILHAKPKVPFTVSVLNRDQEYWSDVFAGRKRDLRLPPPLHRLDNGQVILDEAVAWFSCTVDQTVAAGDHAIVVGRVETFGLTPKGASPLVFYAGGYYHRLAAEYEYEWQVLER